jgi:hypothetical protein
MKIKAMFTEFVPALLAISTLSPQLSTAHAQGTAFTYQGRLYDGTNAAAGNYDLHFMTPRAEARSREILSRTPQPPSAMVCS